MNSGKIQENYKSESSVPTEPKADLDIRGHLNMVAKQ